jgi:hypothetical protein
VIGSALALLLGTAAWAQDNRASWEMLYDSLLLEAAHHDVDQALVTYGQLVKNLGADDPVRSEALYWLGRARYEQGEVDGAREALRECVRTGVVKGRCLELLGQIELEQSSIVSVPVRWTFDDTTHGFVHPWRYAEKGSIRIHREGDRDDPMLAWRTQVDVRGDDQLVVGFRDPDPAPQGTRFVVRSRDLDAALRLQVFDIHGRKYVAGHRAVIRVPRDKQVLVDLRFRDLEGDDPEQVPFSPSDIDRLVLQDVTAFYGGGGGENELYIDDFEVY